jgi:hypothetical protein
MEVIDMRRAVIPKTFVKGNYSMAIMTTVPKITKVEPATGSKGDEITLEGVDFGANEEVTIDFGGITAISKATTNANGSFSKKFSITAAQPNGAVTIKATGATSKQTAENSTFVYSGPRVDSVEVSGSPASTGKPITVTLKGETGGKAKFSIEGVPTATKDMKEDPAGVYTGKYLVEPDVTVKNAVVTVTFTDVAGNSKTDTTHKVTLLSYIEFKLYLSQGINMISIPLDTSATENPIKKVSDLAAVLGDDALLIISYNMDEQKFQSFTVGVTPVTAKSNVDIGRSTGLIVSMKNQKEITFRGNGWEAGSVELKKGLNLISIPSNDPDLKKVSDLTKALDTKWLLIISYDVAKGKFQSFTSTMDPGTPADVPIKGGMSLIVSMKDASSFDVAGDAWETSSPPGPPAPITFSKVDIAHPTSPVLELDGIVTREDTGAVINDLSVTVRHFSTGASMTDTTSDGIFSITFVYLGDHLARVGDILEISAYNSTGEIPPAPFNKGGAVSIDPIRYVLTQSDIELGRISLGNLVASVVPSRSELLANFPNPFNPETWIPFKLKEASDTSITIYDVQGRLVREIELGYIPAGIYQTKAKAAYWDGTNDMGERVASGVYFYYLKAGKFSASRKMVILK